jgi:uncharacterized protein (DUF952 family)
LAIIVHIAKKADWEGAKPTGTYNGDTLVTQGFIHCSTPSQVVGVANAVHNGEKDLVLVCIDTTKVRSEIKYEKSRMKLYPHIYGPLNVDAVRTVLDFKPKEDGTFDLPEGIPTE